jgi:copper/silver efflux system protein
VAIGRLAPDHKTIADFRKDNGAAMCERLTLSTLDGTGWEIMQRVAVPMIGGMISSTLLTLIVIPAIFGLVKGFRLPPEDNTERQSPEITMATVPKIRVLERNG